MLPVANGELIARADPGRAPRAPRGRRAHVLVGAARAQRRAACRSASAGVGASTARRPAGGARRARAGGRRRARRASPTTHAAHVVLVAVGRRQRVDQQVDGALGVAVVQRGEGLGEVEVAGLLEADARGQARRREGAADVGAARASAASGSPRRCSRPASADGGVGAAGLELERAAQRRLVAGGDERVGLGGHEPVEEALDLAGGWTPTNSSTTRPSLNALTAGMPWMPKACGERRVGVGVELGEDDLALARVGGLLEHRARARGTGRTTRPRSRPRRGSSRERSMTSLLEVLLGDVDDGHDFDDRTPAVDLYVEEAGEGIPVVLLHGLTATHRYVVMGSQGAGALRPPRHRLRRARPRAQRSRADPRRLRLRRPRGRPAPRAGRARHRARRPRGRVDGGAHAAALRAGAPRARGGAGGHHARLRPGRQRRSRRAWRAGTRWPTACAAAASRASSRPTATRACPTRGARRW